jgi:hypothetical protein
MRAWLLGLAVGCTAREEARGSFEVSVHPSPEISTVVELKWTPQTPLVDAWVEVGDGPDCSDRHPAHRNADGSWSAMLVGLTPGQHHWAQVQADTGDFISKSQDIELQIDSPPAWLPELELSIRDEDLASGDFLVTSLLAEPSGPVIIDAQGHYVWWYKPYEGAEKVIRARLSRDGRSVLYLEPPQIDTALVNGRALVEVSLDGRRKENLWSGVGLHHDFVELPDGTIGAISYDARTVDEQRVLGDRIVELRPDGSEVEIWNVWDHLTYTQDQVLGQTADWTHANALDYDPEQEVYTISIHNLNTIWTISRDGDVLWRLGGDSSDFGDAESLFTFQHQFDRSEDGILVFDNGTATEAASRVVEYGLDAEDGVAELLWSYTPDPAMFCYVLGDVDSLSDGAKRITWSTAGRIEELDGQGEVVWQVNAALGGAFGYTTSTDSLGY